MHMARLHGASGGFFPNQVFPYLAPHVHPSRSLRAASHRPVLEEPSCSMIAIVNVDGLVLGATLQVPSHRRLAYASSAPILSPAYRRKALHCLSPCQISTSYSSPAGQGIVLSALPRSAARSCLSGTTLLPAYVRSPLIFDQLQLMVVIDCRSRHSVCLDSAATPGESRITGISKLPSASQSLAATHTRVAEHIAYTPPPSHVYKRWPSALRDIYKRAG